MVNDLPFQRQVKRLFEMPENWPGEYGRYYSAMRFAFPILILIHGALILFFHHLDVRELMVFNIFSTLWWCLSFYFTRKALIIAKTALFISIIEMVAHAVFCTYYIGWEYGFAFHLYTLPLVIFLLPKRDWWIKVVFTIVTLAGFYCCAVIFRTVDAKYLRTAYRDILFIVNVSIPLLFSTMISMYYAGFAEESENKLAAEKDKSDFLLKNILPEPIISKLQYESGTIAEEFTEVSVLFADVTDFTPTTADRSPKEVVAFLNNLFSILDEIVERYSLEKIKTIGDAYMVTAGLPMPTDDHLQMIAECALDILDATKGLDFFGKKCNMRIGIHSGPVVAGIIGKKKFSYDLWGDTVNTAARMESQGVRDKIQTTKYVFEKLKEYYAFERRGEVTIKGKGVLETYFLVGRQLRSCN